MKYTVDTKQGEIFVTGLTASQTIRTTDLLHEMAHGLPTESSWSPQRLELTPVSSLDAILGVDKELCRRIYSWLAAADRLNANKINDIKLVRTLTISGLKQAKDWIDLYFDYIVDPPVTSAPYWSTNRTRTSKRVYA